MVDPKQGDVMKNLAETWSTAQKQLGDLREQVQYAAELAQAKVEAAFLSHQLDYAYRDLGEAVWKKVSSGELQLPRSFSTVIKALKDVEARIADNNSGINALLDEGAEVASRRKK